MKERLPSCQVCFVRMAQYFVFPLRPSAERLGTALGVGCVVSLASLGMTSQQKERQRENETQKKGDREKEEKESEVERERE